MSNPRPLPHGSHFRCLSLSLLFAVVATVGDFALALFFVSGLGLAPWCGTALGCVSGAFVSFTLNRVVTFRSTDARGPQCARYFLVSGATLVLNTAGVSTVHTLLRPLLAGSAYPVAWWTVRSLASCFWSYPMQAGYVFARRAPRRAATLD